MEQYNSIQQILKKENGHDRKPIYPSTVIQAVFDAKTGASLEAILAQFNSIYVQYQGSPQATRNIIPVEMRRAGLMITYMNMDSETITEKASSAVQKDNDHWGLDINWSRVDELSLSGDIAVSANGTWIINGVDTKVPARGSKGDTGLTPWLKTIDNKLHYSYDNTTWEPCSDYLAGYFRFSATSSDSQAGTIGKIQVSKDNKTWQDLSPEFRNYLRIQGYVSSISALPKNQVVGTIYGVNEGTNIYSLHVWDGSTWVNNGTFTSIAAGVVQETGTSETEVMSQKAVTEKLSELESKLDRGSQILTLTSSHSSTSDQLPINIKKGEHLLLKVTKKGNGGRSQIFLSDSKGKLQSQAINIENAGQLNNWVLVKSSDNYDRIGCFVGEVTSEIEYKWEFYTGQALQTFLNGGVYGLGYPLEGSELPNLDSKTGDFTIKKTIVIGINGVLFEIPPQTFNIKNGIASSIQKIVLSIDDFSIYAVSYQKSLEANEVNIGIARTLYSADGSYKGYKELSLPFTYSVDYGDSQNAESSYIQLEVGTLDDTTGHDIPNLHRVRSGFVRRMDIRNLLYVSSSDIYTWVTFYDGAKRRVGAWKGWVGQSVANDLNISELDDAITYIRFVFKKKEDTQISETDYETIREFFRQQIVLSSLYDFTNVEFVNSNNSRKGVYIDGNTIRIVDTGFRLESPNGHSYYVAYKADEDAQQVYEYDGSLAWAGAGKEYLYLDTSVLVRNTRAAISKSLLRTTSLMPLGRYILMAAWTIYEGQRLELLPTGLLASTIASEKGSDNMSLQKINNDILFNPDFFAHTHGKELNANNEGIRWFKRFTIGHISDTHEYLSLISQSSQVASEKMDLLINTGDDANGLTIADASKVLNSLNNVCNTIKRDVNIPYLVTPGNHDVTGITHEQYFNIVGQTMEQLSPGIVWGDESVKKTYGYIDYASENGGFRIIMLYPFDYSDGQFANPYQFQSAVFSQKQIDWLIDILLDAAAKRLNVVTMMHYSFGNNDLPFNEEEAKPDAKFYQDAYMIPDIIDAIQNKVVMQKTYVDEVDINNIRIDRDFSSAPDLQFVAHLFGHIHSKSHYQCQKHNGKKYKILMLGETSLGVNGIALNKSYKIPGTITEIAFSALSIDTMEKSIYRISYGAYQHYDKAITQRVEKLSYNL